MTAHDPQTVLDAALLPSPLRAAIIAGYRDLAEANSLLGFADIAQHCADHAAALEYGGRITLSEIAGGRFDEITR